LLVKEIVDEKHPFIYEYELATKARAIMRNFSLRILPVTDKDKKLLGVVSRGTIMIISSSISPIKVRGIMDIPKKTAVIDDDAFQTVKEMIGLDEWYIPVVNSTFENLLRGVFSLEKFVEEKIKTSPEKLAKEVSEIMSTNVIACSPEDEVDKVWRLMQTKSFAGLPVTSKGKLVGIVTQKDLLESGTLMPKFESAKGRFRRPAKIFSIMQTQVLAVRPSVKAIKVAKLMVSKDIGRVPVINDEGELVGILDREDIAKLIVKGER